ERPFPDSKVVEKRVSTFKQNKCIICRRQSVSPPARVIQATRTSAPPYIKRLSFTRNDPDDIGTLLAVTLGVLVVWFGHSCHGQRVGRLQGNTIADRQAGGRERTSRRAADSASRKARKRKKNSSRLRPMTLLSKGAAQRGIRRGGGGGSSSASSAAGAARKTTPRRQHTKQKVASARSSPRLHLTQKRTPDGRGRGGGRRFASAARHQGAQSKRGGAAATGTRHTNAGSRGGSAQRQRQWSYRSQNQEGRAGGRRCEDHERPEGRSSDGCAEGHGKGGGRVRRFRVIGAGKLPGRRFRDRGRTRNGGGGPAQD
ncbi:unnamed protein product, partial [Pylaiella littoralis]